MDARPRTTGEILDDAWRLYLADAPLLLALSTLFTAPAFIALLLLLIQPSGDGSTSYWLLPGVFALLVPLTGLGSGACQAVFRCRAEGQAPGIGTCLLGTFRHGIDHVVARAVVLTLMLPAFLILVMPQLALWVGLATVHPLIAAGEFRWTKALGEAGRQSQRIAASAAVVTLSRVALLIVAILNLHAFVLAVLWTLDQPAGFDVAWVELILSPLNPVYSLSLAMLAWLLMAPFAEASNYLLYVDARTRYEGLDLWYRVRRAFPVGPAKLAGCVALAFFLAASFAIAADPHLGVVKQARREVAKISQEIKDAEPYQDGKRWEPRLQDVGKQLDEEGSSKRGRFQWFEQAIKGFAVHDRAGALDVLQELERRFAVIEDSLALADADGRPRLTKEEIDALLPAEAARKRTSQAKDAKPKDKVEKRKPVEEDEPARERRVRKSDGTRIVAPMPSGGFSTFIWVILAGLLAAMIAVAILRARANREPAKKTEKKPADGELSLEALLANTNQPVGENLWRQADELARGGRFLEALRTLYLGVLALLHRADLIRYGSMRTNGEYLDQLRPRTELYPPFHDLTGLFELKWYGEKSCRPEDYQGCRQLAEQVRREI